MKLLGIIIAGDNGVSMAFFPSVSKAFTILRKNMLVCSLGAKWEEFSITECLMTDIYVKII